MRKLGVDCLIERVKRWFVSCGAGRVSCAGKCMQPIVGRTGKPRVYFIVCVLQAVSASSGKTCQQGLEDQGREEEAGAPNTRGIETAV